MKNTRFYIAVTLIIQSITFLIMFISIFIKKRSLSGAILAISAAGGLAGVYLLWREITDPSKNPRYMYGDMYDEFDMTPPAKRSQKGENVGGDDDEFTAI
ncbi:MAG: hypothetical protein WCQ72_06785 [Eubacteriales bacterium]